MQLQRELNIVGPTRCKDDLCRFSRIIVGNRNSVSGLGISVDLDGVRRVDGSRRLVRGVEECAVVGSSTARTGYALVSLVTLRSDTALITLNTDTLNTLNSLRALVTLRTSAGRAVFDNFVDDEPHLAKSVDEVCECRVIRFLALDDWRRRSIDDLHESPDASVLANKPSFPDLWVCALVRKKTERNLSGLLVRVRAESKPVLDFFDGKPKHIEATGVLSEMGLHQEGLKGPERARPTSPLLFGSVEDGAMIVTLVENPTPSLDKSQECDTEVI